MLDVEIVLTPRAAHPGPKICILSQFQIEEEGGVDDDARTLPRPLCSLTPMNQASRFLMLLLIVVSKRCTHRVLVAIISLFSVVAMDSFIARHCNAMLVDNVAVAVAAAVPPLPVWNTHGELMLIVIMACLVLALI